MKIAKSERQNRNKSHHHFLLNPLSPDIKINVLLTVLHTFLVELVRRICLNINTSYPW